MSLRIQLPLNGNLDNQGIINTTVTNNGASVNTSGKIGSCYSFNGTSSYLLGTNAPLNNNTTDWSFCCWVKVNSSHNGCLYSNRTNTSNNGITIFWYSGQFLFDDGVRWQFTPSTSIANNTQYHLAFTRQAGVGKKFYVNGVLTDSTSTLGTPTTANPSHFMIGASQSGSTSVSGNLFNGYLNDVRVYDHALSAKEVKEISKGLILHYPLTMNGTGNDNIVPGTSPYEVTYTYPSSSYSDKQAATSSIVPSASQYTLSFYAKSTVNGDKARAHWYNPNTVTRCESNQGVVTTASDGYMDFTLSTEWKKYWCVYTQSSTTAVKHLIFPRLFYGSGSGTVSVKCVKLEEGSTPTVWKPNSGDTLYTTLKYNDTTEVDTSGYKYHGTSSGVTFESNSPKYDISTIFDVNADTITPPAIQTGGTTIPQMSVSIQFKTNTLNSTAPNLQSLGENSFARIRLASATSMQYYIKVASTNVSSTYTTKTLTDNVQHQAVFTFNNGIATMYIDGAQVGTTNHSSTGTSLTMSSTAQHLAGYSANSENFLGNLSDFRIYATALSADDVKELYSSSASIANNGTVMCYEFNEE